MPTLALRVRVDPAMASRVVFLCFFVSEGVSTPPTSTATPTTSVSTTTATTTSVSATPSAPTTTSISGVAWTYLGCYPDFSPRTLDNGIQNSIPGQSVSACLNMCASAGYSFGGTEYSVECWCSNKITDGINPVPARECNMPCSGKGTILPRLVVDLPLTRPMHSERHLRRWKPDFAILCEWGRTSHNTFSNNHDNSFGPDWICVLLLWLCGRRDIGIATCPHRTELLPTEHDSTDLSIALRWFSVCWSRVWVSYSIVLCSRNNCAKLSFRLQCEY